MIQSRFMKALIATVIAILAFPLSLTLLFIGSQVPTHFTGIAPILLEFVGEGRPTSKTYTNSWIDRDKSGVARTLSLGLGLKSTSLDLNSPEYRVLGGGEPYMASLIKAADFNPTDSHPRYGVAGVIMKNSVRDTLLRMLQESRNRWVAEILRARSLNGMPRFAPVNSAAGAPLEGAILTIALLIQADALPTTLTEELGSMIEQAIEKRSNQALIELDSVFLNIASLAKRLDWATLREMIRRAETWNDMEWLASTSLNHVSDGRSAYQPFAIWLMADQPSEYIAYVNRWGDRAWEAFDTAGSVSPAAVDFLIEEFVPIHEKPEWLADIYPGLGRKIEHFFLTTFSIDSVTLRWAKGSLFALAGVLVAGSLFIFSAALGQHDQIRGKSIAGSIASGALVCLSSWILTEPSLLAQMEHDADAVHLNFSNSAIIANISPPVMNSGAIDQVTLLVLGVFLLIQLIVYVVCLVRVSDINRQPLTSELKIDLLNNEENLFDLGLYIGLSGTVLSLILISLGIVEASLMAAYASTLFGILFVAVLKVFHVRPMKRRLLMERG